MGNVNPSNTIANLTAASDSMKDLAEYWSNSKTSKNALKSFISGNKTFFEKASLSMGVLSVGCSFADALGLFGPSDNQKILAQLSAIDKKLDDLKTSMDSQFKALSVKVDYVVANAMLKAPESNLAEEINKARFYLEQVEEGNELALKNTDRMTEWEKTAHEEAVKRNLTFTAAARNTLLRSNHDIGVDVRQFYKSFTDTEDSANILKATLNYFAGAPGPLINRGYNILYLVMEAVKVIGLKERLLLEEKYGNMKDSKGRNWFNLEYCVEYIDYQYNKLYKSMIETMESSLNKILTNAIDDTEKSLVSCFDLKVRGELKKGQNNLSIICSAMTTYFPYLNFVAIEFGPFSESNKEAHDTGLRASRALTFYPLKETGHNLHIWWQWRPEVPGVTINRLKDFNAREEAQKKFDAEVEKKVNQIRDTTVIPLEAMKEWDFITAANGTPLQATYNISTLINKNFKQSLYYLSTGAHALIIRRSKTDVQDYYLNDGAKKFFIYKNSSGSKYFYYVFWMLLDT